MKGHAFATALALVPLAAAAQSEDALAARARRLHRDAIVLDTHIDVTQRLMIPGWDFFARHGVPDRAARRQESGPAAGSHVDFPRLREGGLDGLFFSIFMPGTVTGPAAVKRSLEQIDAVRRLVEARPDEMALCTSAAEVRGAHAAGKVCALLGVEGGHMIDESLAVLRGYARLGVRYLTLTHSVPTPWADSSGAKPVHGGLTGFGREVVQELNRVGVMVDVSHVADLTFWAALETSRAPLLASHSSCRALSGHPRNMSDEMIRALAGKGGVIQINYLDAYLDDALYRAQEARRPQLDARRAELERQFPGPDNAGRRMEELRAYTLSLPALPRPSWEKIVEHIEHAARVGGIEHVGLGSDFDGASMPVGMEDVTRLPRLTEALLRRGFTDAQVEGILGGNLLRLMEAVERAAARP